MALIVEDGTARADAESYISVTDADTYHEQFGNTQWVSLSDDLKEVYLRRATAHMLQMYRGDWKGSRVNAIQALDWPRVAVLMDDIGRNLPMMKGYYAYQIDYKTIPKEIKNACAEFALRASIGVLVKDQSQNVVSKSVGPITVVYDRNSPQQIRYEAIDMMLAPFLTNTGVSFKLSRS